MDKNSAIAKKFRGPALAAMAACAGTGFSSGQGMALFFSQTGRTSWIGILIASGIFGLLIGASCFFAARTGADSLMEVLNRRLGKRGGALTRGLYGLLMALAATMMLVRAGELGALALPVKNSYLWGMLIALALTVIINAGGTQTLVWMGGAAVAYAVLFHGALALDVRPVRLPMRMETVLKWENSAGAAAILGILHGCMNGAVAGSVAAAGVSGGVAAPWRTGAAAGGLMLAQLLSANAAILRGGEGLLGAKLPTVILAARWGIAGFWLSIIFMYLCAVSTLAAMLGGMIRQMRPGRDRRASGLMFAVMFLMCCAAGIKDETGMDYHEWGWICAAGMAGLIWIYKDR